MSQTLPATIGQDGASVPELYYEKDVHPLLMLPADMPFRDKNRALAAYTHIKSVDAQPVSRFLFKKLEMTGIYQFWIKPQPKRINQQTGEVIPAKAGWVRTILYVKGLDKPISLGSEPVAETASDVITVHGQGMFPEGETVPFTIESRGTRPAEYYVMFTFPNDEESTDA